MTTEYTLPYTAEEINEKLRKIDELTAVNDIILTDDVLGTQYKLAVTNGKLTLVAISQ